MVAFFYYKIPSLTLANNQSKIVLLLVLPRITPFNAGDDAVFTGDFFTVTCAVSHGDLPMEISWLHNDHEITDDMGISFASSRRINTLTIESVADYNAGNYTCQAKNAAGVDKYTIDLVVNGLSPQL